VHLSRIGRIWNNFYKQDPNPTRQDVLNQATQTDRQFGSQFDPELC
jgi:hypothetical protein